MRQLLTLLTFSTFIILTASQCRKNKPINPVDNLPPETQTGANTFGCLVDGNVFLPKGDPFGGPIKKAQYQFVNGKQGFGISAKNSNSTLVKGVGIQGDSVSINVGTYNLADYNTNGILSGSYAEFQFGNINDFYTNTINRGQLIIKKFDTVNQIVSGTFWFDAKNSSGQIVQIREGRFDLPYVR